MRGQDAKQSDAVCSISPSFKGFVTVSDLLKPSGFLAVELSRVDLKFQRGVIFRVADGDYSFELRFSFGEVALQRNQDLVYIEPDLESEPGIRRVAASWSPTELTLACSTRIAPRIQTKATSVTIPPISLIKYSVAHNLIPTTTFPSSEALREAVNEIVSNLQDQIPGIGAYQAFWDETRDGRKNGIHKPKREVEIHSTLHLLLSDWAMLRSIEVIPENLTAVGRIDFCLVGHVADVGPVSICIEVKHAHAADLTHGLEVQLPAYMQQKRAPYGVFIVLWYKGDWFSKPSKAAIERIAKTWLPSLPPLTGTDLANFQFVLAMKSSRDSLLENIRVFIIDVSKPSQASKA
jgi:hypothetical protein